MLRKEEVEGKIFEKRMREKIGMKKMEEKEEKEWKNQIWWASKVSNTHITTLTEVS
jgi:hypothetical protein